MKTLVSILIVICMVGMTSCRGHRGHSGVDGKEGSVGAQGEQGVDGIPGPIGPAGPSGVFTDEDLNEVVDQVLIKLLEDIFRDVKVCYELSHPSNRGKGNYKDVSIITNHNIEFECAEGGGICYGLFRAPNIIYIGDVNVAYSHEVLHYLKYSYDDDADMDHSDNDWDSDCL